MFDDPMDDDYQRCEDCGRLWYDGECIDGPFEGGWILGADSDCQYGYQRWLIEQGQ